jgi:hypothetical protein
VKILIFPKYSDNAIIPDGPKQGDAFFSTDFELCFRICHQEFPGITGWIEIQWDISASGLCCQCKSTGK